MTKMVSVPTCCSCGDTRCKLRDRKPTVRAARACGEWLAGCLHIGWERSRLDGLEHVWWAYHDDNGKPSDRHIFKAKEKR